MKKYFLGLLFALSSYFAIGQNNSAKSTINSNISNQGLRGITDAKLISTLNAIVDWAGTPASKRLTITQARALTTDYPAIIYITSGTAGLFTLDETDNTTADDGVNTIVTTANNKRYKRVSGSIASITGLQTALDTKAPIANARLTGQVGVNVTNPSYDIDAADKIRAQNGAVFGSGTINANAILDLQSTTKVFYPPRMTQAQRLAIASGSPGAGSLVYQSDGTPGLYAFDTSWKRLFTASDALPASQISAGGAGNVLLGGTTNTWGKVGNNQVDFIWADKIGPGSGFNVVSNAEFSTLDGINQTKTIQSQFYERAHKDSLSINFNSSTGVMGLNGSNAFSLVNLNTWGNNRYLQQTGGNLTGVLGMTNASGLQVYNSSTITADYERGNIGWQSNVFTIDATRGGSGSLRPVGLKSISNTFNVNPGPSLTGRIFDINAISSVGSGQGIIASTGNISNSAGNTYNTALFSTVNQSGSAGHSELYISPYFQAVGGSPRYLIRAGTNSAGGGSGTHTDAFTVDQNGGTVIGGSLSVLGVSPIYSDAGIRVRGLAGIFLAQSIPDVQSRYSAYQWKINGSADNDYNASYMLQHVHKYDMFASANTYTPLRIYQSKVNIGSNALPTEALTVVGNTSISGNAVANGNLNIGEGTDATSKVVTIGNGRTANGTTGINFISDTGGNSGLSIQRQGSAGVNSRTDIVHRGTGDFNIHAYEAAKINFATNSTSRMQITGDGIVSFGGQPNQNPAVGDTEPHLYEFINNNTSKQVLRIVSIGDGVFQNNVHFTRFRGTESVPTALLTGDVIMSLGFRGHDGTSATQSMASYALQTTQDWTPTAKGNRFVWQTTPNNSAIRSSEMSFSGDGNLTVNGRIYSGSGTTSLPAYSFGTQTGHGLFLATSTAVGVSISAAEVARFTSAGAEVKNTLTLTASDGAKSNSLMGGYSMNGGARTFLLDNSSSTATEGFLFRNSNTSTNIMAVLNRGNVGIGTTLPHISTILDLVSTTAGLGLPRMTTTQINAIATPQAGLTVYNTTLSKLCYYNGTAWKQVTDSNM